MYLNIYLILPLHILYNMCNKEDHYFYSPQCHMKCINQKNYNYCTLYGIIMYTKPKHNRIPRNYDFHKVDVGSFLSKYQMLYIKHHLIQTPNIQFYKFMLKFMFLLLKYYYSNKTHGRLMLHQY